MNDYNYGSFIGHSLLNRVNKHTTFIPDPCFQPGKSFSLIQTNKTEQKYQGFMKQESTTCSLPQGHFYLGNNELLFINFRGNLCVAQIH